MWLSRVQKIVAKPMRLVAGILSGTSADAIDVALCELTGSGLPSVNAGRILPGARVSLKHFYSHPYPARLKRQVRKPADLRVNTIADLNVELGQAFAEAIGCALDEAGIARDSLDLIGSHGQTVYHHSRVPGTVRSTLQLGDGDVIAEQLNVPVISDFRMRDIAAGGEGAPLSPYGDLVLFASALSSPDRRVAVLNLGGIANLTLLAARPEEVLGFDTGPANAPLDRLVRKLTSGQEEFDRQGLRARSGKIDSALLQALLTEDAFLKLKPPKTTGFEAYGDEFVERVIARHGAVSNDLLATLTEFVALSIAQAVKKFLPAPLHELIVAGGGASNVYLIERIQNQLGSIKVEQSQKYGVPPQAREALAFAVLANDVLCGALTALPSCTGAKQPVPLGKLSLVS